MDLTPERTLRAALYRGDGPAVVAVLTRDGRRLLRSMPQLAGDGLLCALAQQLPAAHQLATEVAATLRERDWDGDLELADQLDPSVSDPIAVPLRPLPVDLEQLAAILEGDPRDVGGRIDLNTGEVWPQAAFDYARENDVDHDDDEDEDSRWLRVDGNGSRASYHGKGAFGRFKNELAQHPTPFARWISFSAEHQRGRARQWLADTATAPTPNIATCDSHT